MFFFCIVDTLTLPCGMLLDSIEAYLQLQNSIDGDGRVVQFPHFTSREQYYCHQNLLSAYATFDDANLRSSSSMTTANDMHEPGERVETYLNPKDSRTN